MQPRNKRILYYGGVILVGIVIVFLVIQAMLHIGDIGKALGGVADSLRAIVVGCVMAYLLYPLARFAEQFLLYHNVKKKPARTLSTLFALLILLILLVAFAYFIIPQLVVSLPPLVQSLPGMIESFSDQLFRDPSASLFLIDKNKADERRIIRILRKLIFHGKGAVTDRPAVFCRHQYPFGFRKPVVPHFFRKIRSRLP